MSDGTRSRIDGGDPPKITFSPAPSRWLLAILKGPVPFKMVVGDLEGAGPVLRADRLRVGPGFLKIEEPGIDHRRILGVEGDPPPGPLARVAVQIAAVDDEMVRQTARVSPFPRTTRPYRNAPCAGRISIPTRQ